MDDDGSIINFERHRESAAADNRVRCPRCKKFIFMHDVKCEHCGMHFIGEAWQFSPTTRAGRAVSVMGMPKWLVAFIVLALVVLVLFAWF